MDNAQEAQIEPPAKEYIVKTDDGRVPAPTLAAPANPGAKEHRIEHVADALAPAYAKTSLLMLTPDERRDLMAPFSDEEVEIKPDGMLYIPHILIRKRLSEVIGIGQWATLEREHRRDNETQKVYANIVLLIRGHLVGETWVGASYYPTKRDGSLNDRTSLADTLEGLEGDAIRRIAGKKLLCGSQVWEPAFCRAWIARYAESYEERSRSGYVNTRWRRRKAGGPAASANLSAPSAPTESEPSAPGREAARQAPPAKGGEMSYYKYSEDNPFVIAPILSQGVSPILVCPWGKSKGIEFAKLTENSLMGHWSVCHDKIQQYRDSDAAKTREAVGVLMTVQSLLFNQGHGPHAIFESKGGAATAKPPPEPSEPLPPEPDADDRTGEEP